MDMLNAELKCRVESTGDTQSQKDKCDAASMEDLNKVCDNYMMMGDMHMGRMTCGKTHCNGVWASNLSLIHISEPTRPY